MPRRREPDQPRASRDAAPSEGERVAPARERGRSGERSWTPVVWPGASTSGTSNAAVPDGDAEQAEDTTAGGRPPAEPGRSRTSVAVATRPVLETALARARERVESTRSAVGDRAGEKKRATRRLRAVVWGRRVAYVVAALVVAWVVLLSPAFALDPAKIEVSGYGTVVDPTAVRAAVAQFQGTSLAILNTGQVSSDIKDIPGVRQAHVERSWPAGLIITIESREPVAAVTDPSGGYIFVDDQAVQVGRSESKPTDLPTISVPLGENHVRVLQAVLGVVNAMPVALRDRVGDISANTEDSVTFTLRKGPRVEWGSAENSDLKAQVLTVLLESKQARQAAVIDVSAPTLPITKDK